MKLIAHLGILIVAMTSGCGYFYDPMGETKRIPFPVPEEFPTEIQGELYRVWMGNELQIKSGIQTAYILLQGVDNPDRDDATEAQAIDKLQKLLDHLPIRVVVHGTDERKRMIGQVLCGKANVNLAMIQSGWGRFDGTKFSDSEKFKAAEEKAKSDGLGMWVK